MSNLEETKGLKLEDESSMLGNKVYKKCLPSRLPAGEALNRL